MSEAVTATAHDGTVHQLDGNQTLCGQDATGWSRAVTSLPMGLVVFCAECATAQPAAPEPEPPARASRARIIAAAVLAAAVSAGLLLLSALPALADSGMFHHG